MAGEAKLLIDANSRESDFSIGFDFGTTYSALAYRRKNWPAGVTCKIDRFDSDRHCGLPSRQIPSIAWYPHKANLELLIGYRATELEEIPGNTSRRTDYRESGRVMRFKLLLDTSNHTQDFKTTIMTRVNYLKKAKHIKQSQEIITDYLTDVFHQAKSFLETDAWTVELAFAVPVVWTANSNMIMSQCIQDAMRATSLGAQADRAKECNLFMVDEAEAHASHVLKANHYNIQLGDIVLMLDCGGGTTDLGTFSVGHKHPFRLDSVVNAPTGAMCGASDIDQRFCAMALFDLKDQLYLEDQEAGITIRKIVEGEVMRRFEEECKRTFTLEDKDRIYQVRVYGLNQDKVNSRHPRLNMWRLFEPTLTRISQLMTEQLKLAQEKSVTIDKVIVGGGFGDSPCLKSFIRDTLQTYNSRHSTNTTVVFSPRLESSFGVAIGVLLRAESKDFGPKRAACLSVGVMRHIVYQPDHPSYSDEVLAQKKTKNELEGEWYIENVVHYLIKTGKGELASVHNETFISRRLFEPELERWVAREEVVVSESCTEDFFKIDHVKNKGKVTTLGVVEFDLTPLRAHIQVYVPPTLANERARYQVDILITLTLIGRNMQFVAKWRARDIDDYFEIIGSQMVHSMVAALPPGAA
ncbi:hypothetical protein BKA66DRAFT_584980 [Pyrenochaeta sp. MPI-SDFR-AT-0127]|nr:hypothetical protein BKA66DRAFT_584980 [Pyrenochaeta sp. MPI-SDFR-AT-0127]